MSLFESNIFEGHRVGYGSLGAVPSGAAPIASLRAYRPRFPSLPSDEVLGSKGLSHFLTRVLPDGRSQSFTFYGEGDEPLTVVAASGGVSPVEPDLLVKEETPPAHREGDGLLPTPAGVSSTPRWLPWALAGGGVLLVGGIVLMLRKPRAVQANRRRGRRRKR